MTYCAVACVNTAILINCYWNKDQLISRPQNSKSTKLSLKKQFQYLHMQLRSRSNVCRNTVVTIFLSQSIGIKLI